MPTDAKPRLGNSVAWVLWHQYGDKSGASVERVYVDEDRAREDYDLLTEGNNKCPEHEWHLDKVWFVPSAH